MFSLTRTAISIVLATLIMASLPNLYLSGTSIPFFGQIIAQNFAAPPSVGTPSFAGLYFFLVLIIWVGLMIFGVGNKKKEVPKK